MFSILRGIFVIVMVLVLGHFILPATTLPIEKLHRDIVVLLGGVMWMCGEIVWAIKEQKR